MNLLRLGPRAARVRDRWLVPGVCAVLAVLILGPALGPGLVLTHDMVFVPRLPLTPQLLGIGSAAPRAVPSDAVIAILSVAIPGQVVQKAVLVAILMLAGVGAARAVPAGPWGQLAAAVSYCWNPYVAERLGIGHWAVLVGYAALPWVARAAFDTGRGAGWSALALSAGLGSLGGAPAWLMVALVAAPAYLAGSSGSGTRARGVWLALLLAALAMPWAVPALARRNGPGADPLGAEVFAPHADLPAGTFASILTGGGIWNVDVVPPGRDSLPSMLAAFVVLAVAVLGAVTAFRGRSSERARLAAVLLPGLLSLAAVTLLLVPGIARGAAELPGGGLLRDGSRLLGPWLLATAAGFGLAADALSRGSAWPWWCAARWRRARLPAAQRRPVLATVPRAWLGLLAVLPIAALPAMGWGLSGALRATEYPADFADVAQRVDAGAPGAVVVLPFESYRRYPWNRHLPSLDPVPRWLDQPTVGAADLVVRQAGILARVRGEDPFADRIAAALAEPDPVPALARLGVRWVVVDVAGYAPPPSVSMAYAGSALRLYRVPAVGAAGRAPMARWAPPGWLVVLGDVLAVALCGVVASRPRAALPPRARGFGSANLG
jgi:hypothetical protein